MNPHLIRILGLLLIPCLIGDPITASAFCIPLPDRPPRTELSSRIEEAAITPELLGMQANYLLTRGHLDRTARIQETPRPKPSEGMLHSWRRTEPDRLHYRTGRIPLNHGIENIAGDSEHQSLQDVAHDFFSTLSFSQYSLRHAKGPSRQKLTPRRWAQLRKLHAQNKQWMKRLQEKQKPFLLKVKGQIQILREKWGLEDSDIADETARDGRPQINRTTVFNLRRGMHTTPGILRRLRSAYQRLILPQAITARETAQRLENETYETRRSQIQQQLQTLRDQYDWSDKEMAAQTKTRDHPTPVSHMVIFNIRTGRFTGQLDLLLRIEKVLPRLKTSQAITERDRARTPRRKKIGTSKKEKMSREENTEPYLSDSQQDLQPKDIKVYPLSKKDITELSEWFKKLHPKPFEAASSFYRFTEWVTEQTESSLEEFWDRHPKKAPEPTKPFPTLTPQLIDNVTAELRTQNATDLQINQIISVLKLLSPSTGIQDAFLQAGIPVEVRGWMIGQMTLKLKKWVSPFVSQAGSAYTSPTAMIRFSKPGLTYLFGRLLQRLGMERAGRQWMEWAVFQLAPSHELRLWAPVIQAVKEQLAALLSGVNPAGLSALSPEIIRERLRPAVLYSALRFTLSHGSKALVNRRWVSINRVQANGRTPFYQLTRQYEAIAWDMIDVFFGTLQHAPGALKLAEQAAMSLCEELHSDYNRMHFDNDEGVPVAIIRERPAQKTSPLARLIATAA